jgi:hypothetical protein
MPSDRIRRRFAPKSATKIMIAAKKRAERIEGCSIEIRKPANGGYESTAFSLPLCRRRAKVPFLLDPAAACWLDNVVPGSGRCRAAKAFPTTSTLTDAFT